MKRRDRVKRIIGQKKKYAKDLSRYYTRDKIRCWSRERWKKHLPLFPFVVNNKSCRECMEQLPETLKSDCNLIEEEQQDPPDRSMFIILFFQYPLTELKDKLESITCIVWIAVLQGKPYLQSKNWERGLLRVRDWENSLGVTAFPSLQPWPHIIAQLQ